MKRFAKTVFQKLCRLNVALGASTIYGAMLGAVAEMLGVVVLVAALIVWGRS